MTWSRRTFLIATGAAGLTACGPEAPNVLTVSAQAQGLMNPGLDGADRPVTISILQLTSAGAFNSADYFSLQNPSSALGADLVKADTLVLAPGGTANISVAVQPTTSVIGITAGFRDPAGRTVRTTVAAPGSSSGLIISIGPSGITTAMA